MLVAKILTKSRFWKWKIVKDTSLAFTYKGFEYVVDPECIYNAKILIKRISTVHYYQGIGQPIKYSEKGAGLGEDVPLNDVAYIMNRIRMGILGEIGVFISIATLVVLIIKWGVESGA